MLKTLFNPDSSGKKICFILVMLVVFATLVYADHKITRGPDIGEIYYIGPTVTQFNAIYHSTDFGETATCMDSISEITSICADLTPGSLYRTRMPDVLYYSNNYGEYGSWTFRSNDIALMLSGRNEGFIYNKCTEHSEDYGANFIQHSCNGYYGILKSVEIDTQDSAGYALTKQYTVYDSLWLLVSYDNFENFEIKNTFNWNSASNFYLTRGFGPGEIYLLKSAYAADGSRISELWYSNNFGENWIFKNHLLSNNIIGGRQPEELFVLATYQQLMGDVKHTFIYHSLDCGETFTIYHPFAYGPEPYYANFEATPLEGSVPLTVQFTDLSNGEDIQTWEWDFDDDGVVDSHEQNPIFTYQDTGHYSVKLRIKHIPVEDAFIKSNYIHVTENNAINNEAIFVSQTELNNYPNPFNPSTIIHFNLPENKTEATIEIYNIKGQKIKSLLNDQIQAGEHSIIWNGEDDLGKKVSSGVYLYKLYVNDKTELVKKCMLLK